MYSPLLSKREIELFNKLHDRKVRDAETFNHEDYQGVKTSVVDKYPESAHFVYELLQNADDVFATYAEFMLFDDGLIFKHNGTIPFSISDEGQKPLGHINSITSIGNSSKRNNYNKIGKFGVGFKSVFTYTDTPEIYDDKFWFRIENLIVPCLLNEDNKYRDKGETLFYIPFKANNNYRDIYGRLHNLDNPIAFLSNLQKIKVKIIGGGNTIKDEKEYYKKIVDSRKCNGFFFQKTIFNNNGNNNTYLFFSKKISFEDILLDIVVGYGYDDEKKVLKFNEGGKVYCYFPTKENFGTSYIAHAPFILVDNRQSLKDDKFNNELIGELANLAANALVFIRDYGIEIGHGLINENIMRLFPFDFEDEVCYAWAEITRENIIKAKFREVFEKERLFLTNEKFEYVGIDNAYTCTPVTILDYFTDKQLNELTSNADSHFLVKGLCNNWKIKDKLSETFGINELKSEDIASLINTQFMGKQPFDWVFKLYQFLMNEAPKLWKTDTTNKNKKLPFKYAPIILNQKNKWVPPYINEKTHNVFKSIGIENDNYNFVSEQILNNKIGAKFIQELGIEKPDNRSYIESCILPQYDEDTISNNDEHLMFIYDYYKTLTKESEKSEFIKLIKEKIYLSVKNNFLKQPSSLYIRTNELIEYLGSEHEDFVYDESYNEFIEKYSIEEYHLFLQFLGCYIKPKLINKEDVIRNMFYWNKYNILDKFKINNCTSIISVSNYWIDGLRECIERDNFSLKNSLYIWNLLTEYEIDKLTTCRIKYQYYQFYTASCKSDMFEYLLKTPWLYNRKGEKCCVSDIFIEDLIKQGYNIKKDLIGAFGIDSEYKPLESFEGVTIEQIKNEERGRKLRKYTDEQFDEMVADYEEKQRRKTLNQKLDTSSNDFYQRKEQTKKNFNDMFSQRENTKQPKSNQNQKEDQSYEDKLKELDVEVQKKRELEELRASIEEKEKYSFDWFNSLLALEFYNISTASKEELRKSLSLEFGSITKDPKSERVLILSNPSRYIPLWLEEMGSIEVNFIFKNKEDIRLEFEVSNVREYQLLLKVKTNDIERIKEIDWNNCIKATINKNNPIELIGKLQTAFKNLDFGDEDNLKQNLPENIQFLFGPPGTGKTTTLSKKIVNLIEKSEQCKILVLAPTNKACDVLCKKILQDKTHTDVNWLGRFVATGDESIETSGIVIDRDSDLYTCDKCCIVSTIARLPYDGFKYDKMMDIEWDYVIFDEASMISLAYIVFAIYKFEGSQFIVSGDPFQISPIVNEKLWEKENIYTMVNLDRFHNPVTEPHNFKIVNLDTQYRSVPSIGELFSRYTYDGKLKHYRKEDSQRCISINGIPLKSINYITFHVDFYNSIFSPKKLSSSNIHVYSVLFVIEFCRHLIKLIPLNDKIFRVGIICPYVAEAQMIEKLLEQIVDIPEHISFVVGTIHSFQGDECNMILAVFNPPRIANDISFINRKNIINVAISRAEDYLCILMPDRDTKGYENYYELNNLGMKAIEIQQEYEAIKNYTCDELEKVIFGKPFTIENNTFITGHQMANVYSKPTKRYEFRIDDKAADVQFNDEIEFI